MLCKGLRYGVKNFKNEIGLSKHFTLAGGLKRLSRKYPRAFGTAKFTIFFSLTISISMALIPGSNLPGQKQYKLFLLNK